MEDATCRTLKPSVLAKLMLRLLKSKSPWLAKLEMLIFPT